MLAGFSTLFFLKKGEKLSSLLFLKLFFIISLYFVFLFIDLLVFKCPVSEGLFFFPIFVISSSLFSLALGSIFASFNKLKAFLLLSLTYIILIIYSVMNYYFEPQLFLFNPLIIFFPGLVYNEIFNIDLRILIYSTALIVASLAILLPKILNEVAVTFNYKNYYFYTVAILIYSLLFIFSDELRLSTSQEFLKSKFPIKLKNTNSEIYIQDKNISESERILIDLKAQFHFQNLAKIFGYEISGIQIFIFDSDKSKKELLGDEIADFTKPWLKQIFVTTKSFDQTLKHELAHIFLGENSDNLFKVASGFNLGLIEGGAMAIEWDWLENTPEYYSALIKRFYPDLDIEKFFDNYTFATQKSSLSYLVSGAFVRYLIDYYGLKKFLEFYREGDFSKVYKKELKDELNEFISRLNTFYFTENDSLKFKVLFGGQTLFERKCPRSISRMKIKARKLISERSFEKAEVFYSKIYQNSSDQDAFMNLIRAKFYQRKFNEVIKDYDANENFKQINGFSSVYLRIYYALSLAKTGNEKNAKEIVLQLKDLNISSSWNSYFDLILFLITKPELIELIINKNFNEMMFELKNKFPDEPSILVNDIQNLTDTELSKVISAYKNNLWILKDCFYRYLMLGNFKKANSVIEMIKHQYSDSNKAFEYQLELMIFIMKNLETKLESK